MVTIVVVNVNGTMLRVACDGLAKDQVVTRNVVLTGCRELDTEGRDGQPLDTRIWSIPEALIVSYALGKPYEASAEEPPPREPTPEEREAIRQRSVRIDTAAREHRMQERAQRAKRKAEAETVPNASPAEPKRRGRPKKAVAPAKPTPA
jgi:hypothetical protein